MSNETKRIKEAIQHEINNSGSISFIAFMANQEKRGKVNDLDYAEVRGYRSGLTVALEIIDRTLAEMEDDDENCTEPTADVREIDHGYWVKMSDSDGIFYACSICGEELTRVCIERRAYHRKYESIARTPFCPHCGADMRGEKK